MNTSGEGIWDLPAAENCSLRIVATMVRVGFANLSKIDRSKPDFGGAPAASQIQRLAAKLNDYVVVWLARWELWIFFRSVDINAQR
jgi:hypothetical protein